MDGCLDRRICRAPARIRPPESGYRNRATGKSLEKPSGPSPHGRGEVETLYLMDQRKKFLGKGVVADRSKVKSA